MDEVDTGLLQKFGCLQTVDRADLIGQMRRLVGGEDVLSESTAEFYLEMSNWNVHGAVGHYFDLESSSNSSNSSIASRLPNAPSGLKMSFVQDSTVGEGESVPPDTDFIKTWTVRNPGPEDWPPGVVLRLASSSQRNPSDLRRDEAVPALPSGGQVDISVAMRSPGQAGIYESQWRMVGPSGGGYFGDPIWCIVTVEAAGTLALTQQLNAFHVQQQGQEGPSPFPPLQHLLLRPSSPTDASQTVVSARNVLTRTAGGDGSSAALNSPRMDEDDEEMN